jgi:hypothetical protein
VDYSFHEKIVNMAKVEARHVADEQRKHLKN